MTREETKKNLHLITAYANGKTIQYYNDEKKEWVDVDEHPSYSYAVKWRIKPEPEYRPFKSKEECWNEMLKHEPFGWITNGISNHNIRGIDNITVMSGDYYDYMQAFKNLKFIDGQPFGVKTE